MNTPDLFNLAGRVAIVTGGATHLGRAMATALGELGASVAIASRRRELCEEVAAEIREAGIDCTGYGCDVTNEDEVNRLVDEVVASHGRLDVMVCNAGGSAKPPTYVPDGDIAEFTSTIQLNATGTYLCAQAAARVMIPQRSGAIITIGSIHGSHTSDKRFYEGTGFKRGAAAYQTAKGGIINLTRHLAGELRRVRHHCQLHQPRTDPEAGYPPANRRARAGRHPSATPRQSRRPEGSSSPACVASGRLDHRPQPRRGRRLEHLVGNNEPARSYANSERAALVVLRSGATKNLGWCLDPVRG